MKRTLVLLISLFAALCAHAGGDCDSKMKDAIKLLENQDYWNAKALFVFCSKNCGSSYSYNDWIKKCDAGIIAIREHNRRKEELVKKKMDAIEAKKRAEQRERDRLVYLSVYSDVPGKFSHMEDALKSDFLKNGIHCTNDSLKAYFYVRVAVSIFDESSNGKSRYRVYASAEVENATESDYETKNYFTQGEGCCNAEIDVADMIYESKTSHLFMDVENNLIRLLGANNVHDGKDVESSSLNNPINVAVKVTSNLNCSVTALLKSRLENNFDHTGGRYIVLNRDGGMKKELDEWIDAYEPDNVSTNQRNLKGNEMGVDKVCAVRITDANDGLRFSCDFIDMATGEKKTAFYPTSDNSPKVCCPSSIDKVHIVADELTRQLEIPSSNTKDLDKRKDDVKQKEEIEMNRIQDSLERAMRANVARSFIPGFYQLHNNKTRGGLFIAGEALGIGGAIVSHNMRGVYIKKMNSTTNASLKKEYADRANAYTIIRNVSIGATAAVYVWNLADAWSSIHEQKKNSPTKGTVCLNPTITDQSVALSLSINF